MCDEVAGSPRAETDAGRAGIQLRRHFWLADLFTITYFIRNLLKNQKSHFSSA